MSRTNTKYGVVKKSRYFSKIRSKLIKLPVSGFHKYAGMFFDHKLTFECKLIKSKVSVKEELVLF